ncbi:hypothetical protein [Alkalicoccus daliensis]|uniref:Uncharacterized protein n=1 Tax=Alkalicoccus daliensis TaxID=745820 RepID=A0A1H0F4J4_9BACI|nr:hypothetical protein [Alkalicoccus daliensis]SDN89577.1 hypothetical protein SAMN04488053_104187 [Alkalicoccus daliensis]
MKIYGLHGKSGTGKSHKATEVLSFCGAEAMIDDGIVIVDGKRVAGRSAKNENGLITAIKRATFFSDSHREEVQIYLRSQQIASLLILGTSKRMISQITARLELEETIEWIPIEEFQSPVELKKARDQRNKNYHVIPIAPVDVARTFIGSWFRKLIIPFRKGNTEVLMVRPVYAGKNRIIISPQCVKDILLIMQPEGISLQAVKVEFEMVHVKLSTYQSFSAHDLFQWQERVVRNLRNQLGMQYTLNIQWNAVLQTEKKSREK